MVKESIKAQRKIGTEKNYKNNPKTMNKIAISTHQSIITYMK